MQDIFDKCMFREIILIKSNLTGPKIHNFINLPVSSIVNIHTDEWFAGYKTKLS